MKCDAIKCEKDAIYYCDDGYNSHYCYAHVPNFYWQNKRLVTW